MTLPQLITYKTGLPMCKGFIMLSRSFFENELWEAKRTYSDAEAWLDLIQLARFEDGERTVRVGQFEVAEKRGQAAVSIRALAERWGRSQTSVRRLLDKFKNHQMITIDSKHGISIISLLNYEKYNVIQRKANRKTKALFDEGGTVSGTVSGTLTNKDNKANNNSETSSVEDEKKPLKKRYFVSTKTTVEDRRNDRWEQLQPFIPVYGAELVSDFFAYWSAPDKNGKDRMVIDDKRIKVFRIWDRLATWLVKSNGKYNHNQKLADNGIKRTENDGSIVHTDVQANTRYISRWDAARQRADETNGRIADYIKRTLYPDADTVTDSARDSPAVREGSQLCGDLQHPDGV